MHDRPAPTIAILGAGAGGLAAAVGLRRAGLERFTLYEKSDGVGGTWRDNTYPGSCCDVKSHLYSFSWAPNPDWSRAFAEQPEILEYLERVADEFGLRPHIRPNTEITALRWDEAQARWHLTAAGGEEFVADVVISGLGQLNRPLVPQIEGRETFAGTMFHSARWDHGHDLRGERVAVVGNAASAVQFVPRIAPQVAHLDVYQRSANWMLPKPNPRYPRLVRAVLRRVPGAGRVQRWAIYWSFELRWGAFKRDRRLGRLMERLAAAHLRRQVADPALREALTPDYPIGAKRVLAANDFFPALQRPNVDLVTAPIARIVPDGVATVDGVTRPADTIIFATGFDSTHFLAPLRVTGRGGRSLADAWREGAEAYHGVAVGGFPNLFLLYGPNTNLGHNSILFMIECQVAYITRVVERIAAGDADWLDVTPQAQAAYNAWVAEAMHETVWEAVDRSWYKAASGRVTNNWPSSTVAYWKAMRHPRWSAFEKGRRAATPLEERRPPEPVTAGAA